MIQLDNLSRRLVSCRIREYTPADLAACSAVYASNVPEPYPERYLAECLKFLEEGTSFHLVVELQGRIVGCGGLELRGEGPYAHLVFGCIHKDFQGRGFGSTFLAARLSLIEHEGETYAVKAEAAAEDAGFFVDAGFEVAQVSINRLGEGKDGGILVAHVTPQEIEALGHQLAAAGVTIELSELPPGLDEPDFGEE